MTQTADPQPPRPEADEIRQQLAGKHACPFCGVIRVDAQAPCPRCTMEDTPATRQATRQRIGPWFVLQARNPSAPGMKFATLVSLIKKSHVTPRSIVRGPTTHQLWTFAAQIRGLSREFGLCFSCGEAIDRTANVCPHCAHHQEPPADADALLEAGTPEMVVTSQPSTHETGMDGGTSLDLQLEPPTFMPRPLRAATPIAPAPAQGLARVTPRTPLAAREMTPVPVEESILSARELAAAFQLDFKPPGSRTNRKKMGPVKLLVSLLLIAAVSVAIVMIMRPDWRDQSVTWLNSRWSRVRTSLEEPATPSANGAAGHRTPAQPAVVAPKSPVNEEISTRKAPPTVAPVQTPSAVNIPKPAAPQQTPPPAVHVEPPPPAVQAPVVTPPPVRVKAPTPPVEPLPAMSLDQATTLASDLRNQAMDAEVKKDWPTAIQLYERIETLPRDAWPSDIESRLTRARQNAE